MTTLRALTPADLPAAIRLWHGTEGIGLTPDETPELLSAYLDRNPGISSVACLADGTIVGAILGGHDGRRAFLYHLAVVPSERGQGLGRQLAERATAELTRAGLAKASILVYADNAGGRAFWERLGWKARHGLDLMQLPLGDGRTGV